MEVVNFTPKNQLIDQLREITMLTDKSVKPYQDAHIEIVNMPLNDIYPTQLYVLNDHLKVQNRLREDLIEYHHDTFKMIGGVAMKNFEIISVMIPPIVEDDAEYGPCLLDGTHRAYLARQLGYHSLNVVRISNMSKDLPMIAFPNKWGDIQEYDQIPTISSLKKHYRNLPGSKYDYYRDFSSITGIGKDPRSEMTLVGSKL